MFSTRTAPPGGLPGLSSHLRVVFTRRVRTNFLSRQCQREAIDSAGQHGFGSCLVRVDERGEFALPFLHRSSQERVVLS